MERPSSNDAGDAALGETNVRDEELLSAFLNGEEAMFSELVHRHEEPLYSFICRLSGRPSDAADLFQETFVRVFEKAESFRGASSFKTWLYSIAANVCRSHGRKAAREVPAATGGHAEHANGSPGPDAAAASREVGTLIADAVGELPHEQREVFILKVYHDMTYPEIAEATRRPLGTVKSQMRLALRKLREKLRALADAYELTEPEDIPT